jgi:hypothetical protein
MSLGPLEMLVAEVGAGVPALTRLTLFLYILMKHFLLVRLLCVRWR